MTTREFPCSHNKVSPKTKTFCSATDIKCPWTGLREEPHKHFTTCQLESLRSLLASLITENHQIHVEKQQLIEQIKQQNI